CIVRIVSSNVSIVNWNGASLSAQNNSMKANINSAPWQTQSRSWLGWPMLGAPSSGTTSAGTTSSAPCLKQCQRGDGGVFNTRTMQIESFSTLNDPERAKSRGKTPFLC